MNTRQAILAAANQIAANPSGFAWHSTDVPKTPNCGTPGCALGWIGCFAWPAALQDWERQLDVRSLGTVAMSVLGLSESADFYRRMDVIMPHDKWTRDAEHCASALRLYADKYHPAGKRAGIPDSVRAIFISSRKQSA